MELVLEINDEALLAADAEHVYSDSPGYAVAVGNDVQVGVAAKQRARLNPRQTFDRFWQDLDQQPLSRPAGPARHHADLAWFHLRDFWQTLQRQLPSAPDRVLLAVPPGMSAEAMGLLLGICQSCAIPVQGLVDSALAAAVTAAGERDVLLLDSGLHRINAVRFSGNGGLSREQVSAVSKQGSSACADRWVAVIAERFLKQTRFDPLHEASGEQDLYNQLSARIDDVLAAGAVAVEIVAGSRVHRVELTTQDFAGAAEDIYTEIQQAAAAFKGPVLLGHRLARWPGLLQRLESTGPVCALPATACANGALAFAKDIESDPEQPAFVTRLPGVTGDAFDTHDAAERPPNVLVQDTRGWSFESAPLLLDREPRCLRTGESAHGALLRHGQAGSVLDVPEGLTMPVLLNGRDVVGRQPVKAGDRLTLDGALEFQLIAVQSGI